MEAHRVRDEDLHAYVDGHLHGERRVAVERCLAEDAELARRVEDYRAQAALLHELFDPVLREQPSQEVVELTHRLNGRLAGNDNAPPWHARAWVRMAAAIVLVVGGATGGWFGRGTVAPPPAQVVQQQRPALQTFAAEAAQAHRFYTSDERFQVEMGADDPYALDSFLSQRVGRDVFGPDLSKVGYRLIGGRSLPIDQGAGAQYMYANEQGKRITLFAGSAQPAQEGSFSFAQQGDVATFYWVEGTLAYALIGRLSRDELMDITKAVYNDLKAGSKQREQREQRRQEQQPPAAQQPAQEQQQQQQQQNPVQPVSDKHNSKPS